MKYRAEIDGLRAVAVVPVIIFHAGFPSFAGGYVGVDVFFVISGYLITGIILNEMKSDRFRLVNFYERRARRILPALFFVMVLCIPFAWMWLGPRDMRDFAQSVVAVATFSSNILFWLESGYFDTAAELKPLLHTWSLAVEEQYYIIYPLLLMLVRRRIIWVLAAIFVISLGFSHWAAFNAPSAGFFLLPTRGWELLMGAFAAFYLIQEDTRPIPRVLSELLTIAGLSAIGAAIILFDDRTPFPGLNALLPTTGALMIILYARGDTLVRRLLSCRIFVGIGLISYSAYLWHQPLFAFARHRSLTEPSPVMMGVLCLFTLPLAYLTWRLIEQPFRRRDMFTRTHVFGSAAAVMLAFVVFGISGYLNKGFPDRLTEAQQSRYLALDRAERARHDAVRSGVCHYNQRGIYRRIEDYLANWACHPGDENSGDDRLLVFGDSHGADKAMALRLSNIDIVQITGAGCELVPQRISSDRMFCKSLFRLAEQQTGIQSIILANRFLERDITETYLREIFSYWSARYDRVYLFAPMPNFQVPFNQYLKFGDVALPPSDRRGELFREVLSRIPVPENLVIVDTKRILCGEDVPDCGIAFRPTPLLLDAGHLSVAGARHFGENFTRTQKSSGLPLE